MGYAHIDNLYKSQDILLLKECYALEKIHGVSAHVAWRSGELRFHTGESHAGFVGLFNHVLLRALFERLNYDSVTVYGEDYGGGIQGSKHVYGTKRRFIAYDVNIGGLWLAVPAMESVAVELGFEVVAYERIPTDLSAIDAQRDAPSVQAERNGCGVQKREGVVLRPLIELTKNNGYRVIAKHRIEKYSERATPQRIVDPAMLAILTAADEIATEWVTPMRLTHVLSKLPQPVEMSHMPVVIKAMVEDVYREAAGEVVESKQATRAIGKRTVELVKAHIEASSRVTA